LLSFNKSCFYFIYTFSVSSSTSNTLCKITKFKTKTETNEVEYYCPECGRKYDSLLNEFWIQCDACKEWYHGECVGAQSYQADELDQFHCIKCERIRGPSTLKPVTNSHRHNKFEVNPSSLTQSGTHQFLKELQEKHFDISNDIIELKGNQLTMSFLLKKGFNKPILVRKKDQLDMILPPENFDVMDVMNKVGGSYELDVIDSLRQMSIKMPMVQFLRYINMSKCTRPSIYNCISLEISRTRMNDYIKPPAIVNKLSWVENSWPDCSFRPNVSKYCLMSMENSYTDFHIDFGGTSVWYHVFKGEKIFYLIEPTSENLNKYEIWMNRYDQSEVFFQDTLENKSDCKMVILKEGETFFIPCGWIHAVLTTKDSIVFGGNFLHSLSIRLQMKIYEMENRIKTPDKFLFPFFELTNWYAAPSMVLKLIQDHYKNKVPPEFIVEGVACLIEFLKKWNNESRQENSCKNGDYSPLAPKAGINTSKIIKDLTRQLKMIQESNNESEEAETFGSYEQVSFVETNDNLWYNKECPRED